MRLRLRRPSLAMRKRESVREREGMETLCSAGGGDKARGEGFCTKALLVVARPFQKIPIVISSAQKPGT